MKREFLKELGLEQEVIDKIMGEAGKDVEAEKAKVSAAEAERDKYKEQLDAATVELDKTQSSFDLLNPYPWALASVPYDNTAGALFPEASLVNNIEYGKNRALFAWYYIDGIFTRPSSSLRPRHISDDDISNHYVHAISYSTQIGRASCRERV